MDIYIIRKCKVEMKDLPGSKGAKYTVPVMTQEDVHSYVVKEALTPWQREKIQVDLENFYSGSN